VPNGIGVGRAAPRLPICPGPDKCPSGTFHVHQIWFGTSAKLPWPGMDEKLRTPQVLGRFGRHPIRPRFICRWRMCNERCCGLRGAALFANGRVLHTIGIWWTGRTACGTRPGVTRSPCPGLSPWLSASRFMPMTSSAAWMGRRWFRKKVPFMEAGLPPTWRDRSRVGPAAGDDEGNLSDGWRDAVFGAGLPTPDVR